MPTSLVNLHHYKVVGKGGRHMLEKQPHHLGIGRRKNERYHFAFRWRYSSIHVGIFTNDLMCGVWSHSRRSPSTPGDTDATTSSFILTHLQDRSLIVGLSCGERCLNRLRKV